MGRRMAKDSDKARTPFTEDFMANQEAMEKTEQLITYLMTQTFDGATGQRGMAIAALKQTLGVLQALDQERALEAGGEEIKELEARIRKQIAENQD